MGYVFISYSSKDAAEAERLRRLLRERGVETWMAPGDIPAGQKYAGVIVSAIRGCACFLLVLTENTQSSTWVPKEVERAVSFKRPIVTLTLEDVELNDEFSLYISTDQAVRVHELIPGSRELERVFKSVEAYLGADRTEKEAKPAENCDLPDAREKARIRPLPRQGEEDLEEWDNDEEVIPHSRGKLLSSLVEYGGPLLLHPGLMLFLSWISNEFGLPLWVRYGLLCLPALLEGWGLYRECEDLRLLEEPVLPYLTRQAVLLAIGTLLGAAACVLAYPAEGVGGKLLWGLLGCIAPAIILLASIAKAFRKCFPDKIDLDDDNE